MTKWHVIVEDGNGKSRLYTQQCSAIDTAIAFSMEEARQALTPTPFKVVFAAHKHFKGFS